MRRAALIAACGMLVVACGRAGGVDETPPASTAPTTTVETSTTAAQETSTTLAATESSLSEGDIVELEAALDDIEHFVVDTEELIDEPLP